MARQYKLLEYMDYNDKDMNLHSHMSIKTNEKDDSKSKYIAKAIVTN